MRAKLNEISLTLLNEIVQANPYLIAIDLSWNELLGPSLVEFVDTLRSVKRVQYLNLSWNNLEIDEVVENIYTLLKTSRSLLHLDLTSTGLSLSSVQTIIKGVKYAPSLLSVHLGGNEITPNMRESFRKQLKARVRPNLTKIHSPGLVVKSRNNIEGRNYTIFIMQAFKTSSCSRISISTASERSLRCRLPL